jgi:hypothetical protein
VLRNVIMLELFLIVVLRDFKTIFFYIVVVSFISRGKRSTFVSTIDLQQVTGNLYRIKLYRVHLTTNRNRTRGFSEDIHIFNPRHSQSWILTCKQFGQAPVSHSSSYQYIHAHALSKLVHFDHFFVFIHGDDAL